MRRPVNVHGPLETATASRAPTVVPASCNTASMSSSSDTAWLPLAVCVLSATTELPTRNPTLALQVAVSIPRIRTLSPAVYHPRDVVVEGECHQADKQHQADLLGNLAMPGVQWSAENGFKPE